MKRILTIALAGMICAGVTANALNFTPTPMKVTAPTHITYQFDGNLEIPFTLSGKPAIAFLTVYSSGKASSIKNIKNGNMNWHYVNNTDTCIYVSSPQSFTTGNNSFYWDGNATHQYNNTKTAGGKVPADIYTYYIFAYDGISTKEMVAKDFPFGWMERGILKTQNTDGTPLSNPVIYSPGGYDWTETLKPHTNYKWVIGGDPQDAGLISTCKTTDYSYGFGIDIDPLDHSNFYSFTHNINTMEGIVRKFKWVPNGDAELQIEWGEDGECRFPVPALSFLGVFAGVAAEPGGDYLFTTDCDLSGVTNQTNLVVIDRAEGTVVRKLDLSNNWVDLQADIKDHKGPAAEGPSAFHLQNGKMALGTWWSYQLGMMNPYAENDEDAQIWYNGNGDGYADMLHGPNDKWEYKYTTQMDANYFQASPAYDLGAVSFLLMGPDGTGMGHFAYSGETAGMKYGTYFVDYDSAFDGIYMDNAGAAENTTGWWWVGHDSVKGTISNQVDVAEAAPAPFTVAQNVPNPFNPTTTISFTLAQAGKTTVEVYNVAGQKVDTLVNASLKAGSHSVTWNATKFSAGVYFYTVKSGSFSRTMKMTLLK